MANTITHPAAVLDRAGKVIYAITMTTNERTISVAGATTTQGEPVNVRTYRISRSRRNLAAASDQFEIPHLSLREHAGAVFYVLEG
jgi:hypothetical protein